MRPQTNKVEIYASVTKPDLITLLSQGIYDDYTLLIKTERVTPDKKTINKTFVPDIRKFPKTDHGGKIAIPKIIFT